MPFSTWMFLKTSSLFGGLYCGACPVTTTRLNVQTPAVAATAAITVFLALVFIPIS